MDSDHDPPSGNQGGREGIRGIRAAIQDQFANRNNAAETAAGCAT
ncbi:hypothetical protein [Cryobacterium sp. Sr8]|nr:hypothetical protein [Cryobacterium sp. Sr8]